MGMSARLAGACFALSLTLVAGAVHAQSIVDQKHHRSAAELKIDANLLFASRAVAQGHGAGSTSAAVPPHVQSFIDAQVAADGTVFVVIHGKVTNGLVTSLGALGAREISEYPQYDTVTARVPADKLVAIAQRADVNAIGPRDQGETQRYIPTPEERDETLRKP